MFFSGYKPDTIERRMTVTDTHLLQQEGDLYMVINCYGYTFEIRYGYYKESDRKIGEPVVIYPDLKNNLVYNKNGYPLVTAVQIPCEHYQVKQGDIPEECCSDCIYYKNPKKEIDICLCENNRIDSNRNVK